MLPLDDYIKKQLVEHVREIESALDADLMTIISPVLPGLDIMVRDALEEFQDRKSQIAIIHDTSGGVVEVVERMVEAIRHYYEHVTFIVPDRAMSAGTIFALSADRIFMDYFSCLGPIDPQVEREGKLVPALSYLKQFERLNEKAESGQLTSAEYALLSKLDLGELYQFEQARELSKELLIKWLSKYKFKDWKTTETRGVDVNPAMREEQARKIADTLNDTERWHSHGRGIDMQTLINEIGLKIEDYSEVENLGPAVKEYFELLRDYMARQKLSTFVHTEEVF